MSPNNSKGIAAPPQQSQHVQTTPGNPSSILTDGAVRRNSGLTASRVNSTPRSTQNQRKQNKTHRRPCLQNDEDPLEGQAPTRSAGSRRGQTNITHLMSFALPPRPSGPHSQIGHGVRRNLSWGLGSGYHAADKAKYIHANYRFIVHPQGDYSAQLINPDIHLDWDQILQVLATITEDTSCPICLSTPVAPRMAKCGHIFCLPCIIRYIQITSGPNSVPDRKCRWKPCPICFDSVFMHEVKSVRWTLTRSPEKLKEGHDIVLQLLMRRPNSTVALPRDRTEPTFGDPVPWHFEADVFDFAHFLKGSETYMEMQYENEIKALSIQEKEDEVMFGEETIWFRKAIASIRDLKEKIKGIGEAPRDPGKTINPDSTSLRSNDAGCFFFYIAPLHSYLSPLDIRILKVTFGDFAAFPSTLLPRVEHISTGHVVDEDIRKRAKYLNHLPMGHEINFLECDWTEIVPPDILRKFGTELDKRRRRNHEKALREEKARIRAQQSEDKKLYGNRQERSSIVKEAEIEPGSPYHDDTPLSSSAEMIALSTSPSWTTPVDRQNSSFTSLTSMSPPGPRTVWGTPAINSSSPEPLARHQHLVAPEDPDGWLQNWENDLLDEDDLAQSARAISLTRNTNTSATSPENTEILKKRKKKTKITLMSTNGRRAA